MYNRTFLNRARETEVSTPRSRAAKHNAKQLHVYKQNREVRCKGPPQAKIHVIATACAWSGGGSVQTLCLFRSFLFGKAALAP